MAELVVTYKVMTSKPKLLISQDTLKSSVTLA